MQIPGVHIETLHNPTRYSYAQIEKACTLAAILNAGSWSWSSRRGASSQPARDVTRWAA